MYDTIEIDTLERRQSMIVSFLKDEDYEKRKEWERKERGLAHDEEFISQSDPFNSTPNASSPVKTSIPQS